MEFVIINVLIKNRYFIVIIIAVVVVIVTSWLQSSPLILVIDKQSIEV